MYWLFDVWQTSADSVDTTALEVGAVSGAIACAETENRNAAKNKTLVMTPPTVIFDDHFLASFR
jgi:hypothetical protein